MSTLDTTKPLVAIQWKDVHVTCTLVGPQSGSTSVPVNLFPNPELNKLPFRRGLKTMSTINRIKIKTNTSPKSAAKVSGLTSAVSAPSGASGTANSRRRRIHSNVKPFKCKICGWGQSKIFITFIMFGFDLRNQILIDFRRANWLFFWFYKIFIIDFQVFTSMAI